MGRKLGAVPFWRGELDPHATLCGQGRGLPASKFHLDPSTVWPQYTNVTDRTERQDRETGQRSDRIWRTVFGRPFEKRLALCYRTVVCPVCNVGVLWPNGWTDQVKLSMQVLVGVGPGHIVLDGDPAPLTTGAQLPVFDPCLLWPNGRPSQLLLSTCTNVRPKTVFTQIPVQCVFCIHLQLQCSTQFKKSFFRYC